MMTRPTSYSQETADAICDHLAEGKSLRRICEGDAMPARTTVFRWLQENAAFRVQYARVCEGWLAARLTDGASIGFGCPDPAAASPC
jgi:hypothetical protein